MHLHLILVFATTWSIYYFILSRWKRSYGAEWISRVVAMTHSLVVCRCIEYCMYFEAWPFDTIGDINRSYQNLTLCLTAGYFIFEILWCLYMQTEGVLMLLHHGISISAMLGSLISQQSASEVLLTTWGSELTNPFLQIRWFLRETKSYNTPFAFFNDWVFFVLFTIVRACVGTFVAYYSCMSTKSVFLMKVCGVSFYLLSLVWTMQIFKFAQKRIFGGLKARQVETKTDRHKT